MPAVTAYGLDYSARELKPAEIDEYNRKNPYQRITFLVRYIGYPGNRKCISAYPGALRAHEDAGRRVLLVHQVGYLDFHGGYESGRAHANIALADARRVGYPDEPDRPIFFAFDRWLSGNPAKGIPALPIATVWQYLEGAKSVLGDRAGLYGFHDVIHPAIRERRVRWTWLCGAESGVIDGVSIYQWNNGRVYPGGLECDLNKAYVDLSEDTVSWSQPVRTYDEKDLTALDVLRRAEGTIVELYKTFVPDGDPFGTPIFTDNPGTGQARTLRVRDVLHELRVGMQASAAREAALIETVRALAEKVGGGPLDVDALMRRVDDTVRHAMADTVHVDVTVRTPDPVGPPPAVENTATSPDVADDTIQENDR